MLGGYNMKFPRPNKSFHLQHELTVPPDLHHGHLHHADEVAEIDVALLIRRHTDPTPRPKGATKGKA